MTGGYQDLLVSLPKSKRDVVSRCEQKTQKVIDIAKKYDRDYFDGDRKYGYGGYQYDGRWKSVAKDLIVFFGLKNNAKILDIGCAKGYLLKDLRDENKSFYLRGLDISKYAIKCAPTDIKHKLKYGTADRLPFKNKEFDLVVSINTLHNLPRDRCIKALQEIERVAQGNSYVVVDSYYTEEQKQQFQEWVLTAETYGPPDFWLGIFKDAGYSGYYSWNIMQ